MGEMNASLAPLAMLFLSPVLIGATRSRSSASLLRLLVADAIAIAIVIALHATNPNDDVRLIVVFYMTALAALVMTGTLLGASARFAVAHWYARTVARRASP